MVIDLNKIPAGEELPGFGCSHHAGCHGVPFHGPWETLTPAQLRVLYNMVEVPVNYQRIHHFVTHQPDGRAEHSWISWPPSQQATRRGPIIHSFEWKNLFHGVAPAPAPTTRAPADVHTSPFLSMMQGRRSSVRLEELDSSSDDTKSMDAPKTLGIEPTRRRSSMYRQNQHHQAEHIGSSSQHGAKNRVEVDDIRAPPPNVAQQRCPAIQIDETVPPAPTRNCNNRGLHRALRKAHQQAWTAEQAARHAPGTPPPLPPRPPCNLSQAPPLPPRSPCNLSQAPPLPPRPPCNFSQAGGRGMHRGSPSLATVLSVFNLRRPTASVPAPVPAAPPVLPVPVRLVPVRATCSVPPSVGKKRPSPSSDAMSAPAAAGSPKFKLFNVEIDVGAEKARLAAGGRHGGHGTVNPPGRRGEIDVVGNALSYASPVEREENPSRNLYKPKPKKCNTTAEWSPYNMSW